MAVRYSGRVKLSIRYVEARAPAHKRGAAKDYYAVTMTVPSDKSLMPMRVEVGAPVASRIAVDSPEAYDLVAHAAITFTDEAQEYASVRDNGDTEILRTPPSGYRGNGSRKQIPYDVLQLLKLWHGGQAAPTYAVLSSGVAGRPVDPELVEDAVRELTRTLNSANWSGRRKDKAELKRLIGELDAVVSFGDFDADED